MKKDKEDLIKLVFNNHAPIDVKYTPNGLFQSRNYVRVRIEASQRDSGNVAPKENCDSLYDDLVEFIRILDVDKTKFRLEFTRYHWFGTDGYEYYHSCYIHNIGSISDISRNLDPISDRAYKLLSNYNKLKAKYFSALWSVNTKDKVIDALRVSLNVLPDSEEIKNKIEELTIIRDNQLYCEFNKN